MEPIATAETNKPEMAPITPIKPKDPPSGYSSPSEITTPKSETEALSGQLTDMEFHSPSTHEMSRNFGDDLAIYLEEQSMQLHRQGQDGIALKIEGAIQQGKMTALLSTNAVLLKRVAALEARVESLEQKTETAGVKQQGNNLTRSLAGGSLASRSPKVIKRKREE